MTIPAMDAGHHAWHDYLAAYGQEHVLTPDLSAEHPSKLYRQLQNIDFSRLNQLYREADSPAAPKQDQIRSADVVRLAESFEDWEREQAAVQVGEKALADGQVAVLLVAGGQGTRLGFDGPKGTFPIGPVSGNTLFQIHTEKLVALSRRYQSPIPFFVMTSPDNDVDTRAFFEHHHNFGLEPGQLQFFQQGTMPAVDQETGKLLLSAPGEIAVSPNGHGGVLTALAQYGHVAELLRRGFKYLFYYQVDNPLVKVADAAFLGYHIQADAELSTKVVAKLNAQEKMGMAVQVDGVAQIIEYSDLPKELAAKTEADGRLSLWAGSTAIHIFNLNFLERITAGQSLLPFHRALKPVPFLDGNGKLVTPSKPNAYKFEMFVFDAIPLARKAIFVEAGRAEEFEPLKNADGANSPTTVKQAMSNLYAHWLIQAGVEVARQADGASAVPIEISPLFALDAEELRDKVQITEPVTSSLFLHTND